jgi:non-heme chloroperoxidase
VLILHGEDDQICPIDTTGRMAVKLLKNGSIKTYPGYPHGMATIHADVLNPDILAFIRS